MLKEFIAYYKNNPKGYWFKSKPFGWGWMPVRWQGWLVTAISICMVLAGIYVGHTDDAPGAALLGVLIALGLIFYFGYKKGERPHWQWSIPKEETPDSSEESK